MRRQSAAPKDAPRIVFADQFSRLAADLRVEAETARDLHADGLKAALLDKLAERVEEATKEAAAGVWVRPEDAAPLLGLRVDSVRARCRRSWAGRGLAKKEGGWLVHVDVLAPARAA